MNENEYISRLKARDIRPTALRLLILRTMAGPFCLRGVAVPQVGLPDGFSAETINFVIKGICADCSGRN